MTGTQLRRQAARNLIEAAHALKAEPVAYAQEHATGRVVTTVRNILAFRASQPTRKATAPEAPSTAPKADKPKRARKAAPTTATDNPARKASGGRRNAHKAPAPEPVAPAKRIVVTVPTPAAVLATVTKVAA